MKPLILLALLSVTINAFAQQTFDIINFKAPDAWEQTTSDAGIRFMKEDAVTGGFCFITLYKSVPGTADAKENFKLAWTSLVKDIVHVNDVPEMSPSKTDDGFDVMTGHANFERDSVKGVAILINSTGFGKMVNILILTNTDIYEKQITAFLESVNIKKQEENVLLGTWGISSTTASYTNMSTSEGSTVKQYSFKPDGTYSFYIKTFRYQLTNLLLTRETGRYSISGNTITIVPQKSATEAWSKKDGTDNWGKLVSSQKRELEKVTYQFSIERFETGSTLQLRADKQTKRDGVFNNYDRNAWLYPSKPEVERIKLPEEDDQAAIPKPVTADGYTFNTTNFDNGWTSTVHEDWVQAVKGTTRALIHYPSKETGYNSDAMQGLKHAWNVLVAPKYSGIGTVDYKPIRGYESMEIAEADAVDKLTGQQVHVVLFKKNYSGGNGRYIECITPDRNLFVQEFGEFDPNASNWEKVEALVNYNKFAVSASDLMGKWTSNFSGSIQYVNAYTGLNAGMNTHASNEKFHFNAGNTYTWELGVASGMVGNIKFQSAKAAGKFKMVGNWQVNFSDIEGKPKTYDVAFVCMKGMRVLWMGGTAYVRE